MKKLEVWHTWDAEGPERFEEFESFHLVFEHHFELLTRTDDTLLEKFSFINFVNVNLEIESAECRIFSILYYIM